MATLNNLKKMALSFPEATELPHFENLSFRVKHKIFATFSSTNYLVCVKLTDIDQSSFCAIDHKVMYPVPNKWGKIGWTFIDLKKVKQEMLLDALTTAYCTVAPKKLSKPYTELRKQI